MTAECHAPTCWDQRVRDSTSPWEGSTGAGSILVSVCCFIYFFSSSFFFWGGGVYLYLLLQFTSVWDSLYRLQKGHSTSSSCAYNLQAISCGMSLSLCLQVMSQAPQHLNLAKCKPLWFIISLSLKTFSVQSVMMFLLCVPTPSSDTWCFLLCVNAFSDTWFVCFYACVHPLHWCMMFLMCVSTPPMNHDVFDVCLHPSSESWCFCCVCTPPPLTWCFWCVCVHPLQWHLMFLLCVYTPPVKHGVFAVCVHPSSESWYCCCMCPPPPLTRDVFDVCVHPLHWHMFLMCVYTSSTDVFCSVCPPCLVTQDVFAACHTWCFCSVCPAPPLTHVFALCVQPLHWHMMFCSVCPAPPLIHVFLLCVSSLLLTGCCPGQHRTSQRPPQGAATVWFSTGWVPGESGMHCWSGQHISSFCHCQHFSLSSEWPHKDLHVHWQYLQSLL